jgi:hypothetical protein
MKKLGKLNLNQNHLIRNEELFTLRGGYGTQTTIYCKDGALLLGCIDIFNCDFGYGLDLCKSHWSNANGANGTCGYINPECGID